jgi:hypothetical protein
MATETTVGWRVETNAEYVRMADEDHVAADADMATAYITVPDASSSGGFHYCAVAVHGDEGEANARAERIVTAVNAHDALVTALQEWVDFADRLDRDAEPGDPLVQVRRQVHGARVERSRAALAAAKGGR